MYCTVLAHAMVMNSQAFTRNVHKNFPVISRTGIIFSMTRMYIHVHVPVTAITQICADL